jgi:hypothetical protein
MRALNSTVLVDMSEAATETDSSVRLGAYRSLGFQARGSERPFGGIHSGSERSTWTPTARHKARVSGNNG